MNRKGDWFQTYTGKKFYPFDPRPEDVDIIDIAHSLALQCRFNGHTTHFYSVAQHSIHVCHVFGKLAKETLLSASRSAHLCALLHDSTEAYVGDLIRPIKIGLPDFKHMEELIWQAVLECFDLKDTWSSESLRAMVKQADNVLLMTERRDLLPDRLEWSGDDENEWLGDDENVGPDPDLTITSCPLDKAETWFLQLFNSLQ
jgi:5'-deoxynucleotidase YfbR-like HD superfamily hydrolase